MGKVTIYPGLPSSNFFKVTVSVVFVISVSSIYYLSLLRSSTIYEIDPTNLTPSNSHITINNPDNEQSPIIQVSTRKRSDGNSSKHKVILYWTWLYQSREFMFGLGSEPFAEKCPASGIHCRATSNKKEFAEADAVIFSMYTMGAKMVNKNISRRIPQRAKPEQVYVFWNDEPPAYGTYGKLHGLTGVFNVTVSYRLDSTIYHPVYRLVEKETDVQQIDWLSVLETKSKLVAWVVSACQKLHSQRMRYAQALKQYIPVDIYGKCGNLTLENCSGYLCFEQLQVTYKFYLAFENSICQDYMTEKVFRTMSEMWVPVVLGGANYTSRLPPHSFIDVRDFKSPKELAKYLKYLDEHDEEYLKYMQYKHQYKVVRRDTKDALCTICAMINANSSVEFEKNLDAHKWWQEDVCIPEEQVLSYLHLE